MVFARPVLAGRILESPGDRSSVGRASGCGPEGRGFEPRRSPWLLQGKRKPGLSEVKAVAAVGQFGSRLVTPTVTSGTMYETPTSH